MSNFKSFKFQRSRTFLGARRTTQHVALPSMPAQQSGITTVITSNTSTQNISYPVSYAHLQQPPSYCHNTRQLTLPPQQPFYGTRQHTAPPQQTPASYDPVCTQNVPPTAANQQSSSPIPEAIPQAIPSQPPINPSQSSKGLSKQSDVSTASKLPLKSVSKPSLTSNSSPISHQISNLPAKTSQFLSAGAIIHAKPQHQPIGQVQQDVEKYQAMQQTTIALQDIRESKVENEEATCTVKETTAIRASVQQSTQKLNLLLEPSYNTRNPPTEVPNPTAKHLVSQQSSTIHEGPDSAGAIMHAKPHLNASVVEAQQDVAVQMQHMVETTVNTEKVNCTVRKETTATAVVQQFAQPNKVEKQIYVEIIEKIFIDITQANKQPMETLTRSEKGIDLCCQAFSCHPQNPCRRRGPNAAPLIEKEEFMSPTLRFGRAKGSNVLSGLAFPLVGDKVRCVWILFEVFLVILNLSLSIATFITGSKALFNWIHLGITIVSAVLAGIDVFVAISNCGCSKKDSGSDSLRCSCCKTVFDIGRTILTELILTPQLILDMFEIITSKNTEATDILGIVLFAIGCLGIVLYVYVARLVILASAIRYIQRAHTYTPPENDEVKKPSEIDYDPTLKRRSLVFQVLFYIHVFGQMLVQVVMLVAVGAQIRYDNQHLYDPSNTDDRIQISITLLFMCIAVCILPFCGYFTFLIFTAFWTNEFPISLCIDFFKLIQTPGYLDLLAGKRTVEELSEKLKTITNTIQLNKELSEQYNKLKKTKLLIKVLFPFKSPMLVFLCFLYGAGQLTFFVCAGVAYHNTKDVVFLTGGGWLLYYTIIAAAIDFVANLYVLVIGLFWVIVIVGAIVIYIFLALLAAIFYCCVLHSVLCGSKD